MLTRLVTRLLTRVVNMVEKIANGDLRQKMNIHQEDEIGILIKSMNTMSEKLENALSEIKILSGMLTICSSCKKIRDDKGYWNLLESYIEKHSEASFSHSLCPECSDKLYGDQRWYIKMKKRKNKNE